MDTSTGIINEPVINTAEIRKAALVVRALRHKLRGEIMHLIHENNRMTVTPIYVKLRLEQSVASQHLGILRKANLVLTERQGKFIFYSINYQRVKEVMEFARNLETSVTSSSPTS